ncbi:MAG: hypothetical protein HOH95_13070 [Dehalococcoidia bacterium]|nr:hypothetical protein [Dehalococcoidia bacterium]
MTQFNRFVSYYIRSALPFLSGIAFGIFLMRWDHPLWIQVLAGLILVVVGPFAIRLVLTLIVEALRGVPEHQEFRRGVPEHQEFRRGVPEHQEVRRGVPDHEVAERAPSEHQEFRRAIQDEPRPRHRPITVGSVKPRPTSGLLSRFR